MGTLLHAEWIQASSGPTMKRIDLIAGARLNFMKIVSIIDALKQAEGQGESLWFRLIHKG